MKRIISALLLIVASFSCFAAGKKDSKKDFKPAYKQAVPEGDALKFKEIWGWVVQGNETDLDYEYPLTDIGYFAASVDCYGNLAGVPDYSKLQSFPGRVHLVLVCDSKALTHFVVNPQFGLYEKMIKDIMVAVEKFDGLQVDYELIPGKDASNFMAFLERLSLETHKKGKMFTVCVPARTKTIPDDMFPYKKIGKIADRVMIMAYDEHWSTSKAGPIASSSWCEKIVDYAITVIPQEKLCMGLPFYGRTWSPDKVAQAWYFSGMNRIMDENDVHKVEYVSDIPTVSFEIKARVTGWFEDTYSLVKKLNIYKKRNVDIVAFWRVGQEDPEIWKWLKIDKDQSSGSAVSTAQ